MPRMGWETAGQFVTNLGIGGNWLPPLLVVGSSLQKMDSPRLEQAVTFGPFG